MLKEGNRPEEALTSSEQELRLLVEAIPALVWRAGPGGKIEYVNKRVLDYLGAPLSEVIGRGWMEKVHPDDVAFKVRTWLQNLESGKPHDAVCRFRGADGRYRWFEVRGRTRRNSHGPGDLGLLRHCAMDSGWPRTRAGRERGAADFGSDHRTSGRRQSVRSQG